MTNKKLPENEDNIGESVVVKPLSFPFSSSESSKIKTWYASEIWKDIENSNGFLELSEEFISKEEIIKRLEYMINVSTKDGDVEIYDLLQELKRSI